MRMMGHDTYLTPGKDGKDHGKIWAIDLHCYGSFLLLPQL